MNNIFHDFNSNSNRIICKGYISSRQMKMMLDLFAQLFQHCWGHTRVLHMVSKVLWVYPSHDALQVPTLSGVVASVCTALPTRTWQLPALLAQQRWELSRPFARSFMVWFKYTCNASKVEMSFSICLIVRTFQRCVLLIMLYRIL